MDIIFYSTRCPKCHVLKKKLDGKHLQYEERTSVDEMLALGISQVPVLVVGGIKMEFKEAVKWVNQYQENDAWTLN